MGTRTPQLDFEHDDHHSWLGDFIDDEFESGYDEKPSRRNARRKQRARQRTRDRFSDYEGERWLKRQIADWDDYDTFDDDELRVTVARHDEEE